MTKKLKREHTYKKRNAQETTVPCDERIVHKSNGVKRTLRKGSLNNIEQVEKDYTPDFDIFTDENNLTFQLKNIIFNDLDIVERRIILLYAEQASLRKVGKILGISASKTFQVVKDIKEKIKQHLNEYIN